MARRKKGSQSWVYLMWGINGAVDCLPAGRGCILYDKSARIRCNRSGRNSAPQRNPETGSNKLFSPNTDSQPVLHTTRLRNIRLRLSWKTDHIQPLLAIHLQGARLKFIPSEWEKENISLWQAFMAAMNGIRSL